MKIILTLTNNPHLSNSTVINIYNHFSIDFNLKPFREEEKKNVLLWDKASRSRIKENMIWLPFFYKNKQC